MLSLETPFLDISRSLEMQKARYGKAQNNEPPNYKIEQSQRPPRMLMK